VYLKALTDVDDLLHPDARLVVRKELTHERAEVDTMVRLVVEGELVVVGLELAVEDLQRELHATT
jgi:hypothetical protein